VGFYDNKTVFEVMVSSLAIARYRKWRLVFLDGYVLLYLLIPCDFESFEDYKKVKGVRKHLRILIIVVTVWL
jgi:hypothetical protein